MKLIINADDLGLNPIVNAAIETTLKEGAISSSTILANSNCIEDVKRIVVEYPNASFGVHLNLTEGKSFTNSSVFKRREIIDEDGCFIKEHYKSCFSPNEELKAAIAEEWDSQIEYLKKEGFVLSHADGHHHCHTWPGLEGVLTTILKKHGLTKVRMRYKYPIFGFKNHIIANIIKGISLLSLPAPSKYRTSVQEMQISQKYTGEILTNHLKTTEYFGQYQRFVELFKKHPEWNADVVVECMCHPGNDAYPDEFNNLLNNSSFINNKYKLISYKEL